MNDDRWVVMNPTSGTADHHEAVRREAAERGYVVRETEREEHAEELAREAVETGAERLGVAGGDGTFHEVVTGLLDAEGLDDVTVGVLPAGTANIFASTVGIEGVSHGFEVLETGREVRMDLGVADGEPFAISCIAGLPAIASVSTSSELKERFGALAFVVEGLREAASFDGLHVGLTAVAEGEETTWEGEAICLLVGNLRKFAKRGGQANAEDGLLDVVVIEQMARTDIVSEAISQRVLGRDTEHVRHVHASQLEIEGHDGEPIDFSLDGELSSREHVQMHARPRALRVAVGPDYESEPSD